MKIQGIVETAIYVHNLDATEDFYGRILGLKLVGKVEGHHVFFHAGDADVLLAFMPDATLKGDVLPPHGAKGPGHFALGIEQRDLDDWRQHLKSHNVAIEKEVEWPRGGRSIYFRDPTGNSVELVTPQVWGLPSGW